MRKGCFLFPLLLLALVFVAFGWRNAHFSNEENEVWLAIPDWYLSSKSGPFAENRALFTAQQSSQTAWNPKPLTADDLRPLQIRYPKIHLINAAEPGAEFSRTVIFKRVNFFNRFSAQCSVSYSASAGQRTHGTITDVLVLARSPLSWDGRWRVVESQSGPFTVIRRG